jgi:ribose/xylose/arabinose/galactoside ABC-type transport system permease subunit
MANTTTDVKAAEVETRDVASTAPSKAVHRKLIENSVTLLVFLALFGAFGIWLGGTFLNIDGRLLDVHQNVPTLLLALAVLVTLVPGQFDLSVAGVATLACFLSIGLRVQQGWPMWAALTVTLLLGVLIGLVNGFLVEVLKVNAFIATLGIGAVCAGASAVYSHGTLVQASTDGPQLSAWFSSFATFSQKAPAALIWLAVVGGFVGLFFSLDRLRPAKWSKGAWLGVKLGVLAVIALVLVLVLQLPTLISSVSWLIFALFFVAFLMWVLLKHTTFGRHIQAIGSNREAALLAGVKVRLAVIKSFVLGGAIAALAGILLAATQGSASPDIAGSFLLPAFAAAFLSTVILSDGRFTVPGTMLGGIFVIWVGLALILGGLPATWLSVVNGVVLIGAVALSTALRRGR